MWAVTAMTTLLVISLPATALEAPPKETCPQDKTLLARAIQLHQSGAVKEAISAYRQYLDLCPDQPQIRSNLGAALAHVGRYDEAVVEYEKALASDQANAAILMNLAIALYKAERLSDAARELEKIHKLQPQNRNALMLLADCHLRRDHNKQVIELIAPIEKENPEDLALAYMLGTAYIRDGQYAKGGVFIDRILRKENSAEALVLMGEARQGVHDNIRAVEDFARAAELKPELPGVHTLHGLALLEIDDRAAAEKAFREALIHDPNDFEASRQLGILAKLHGRHEEALSLLERAQRLQPGALDVSYEIATLMITLGRTDDALAMLQSIIEKAPAFLEAHVSLATLYYRIGRREDGNREREIVRKIREERRLQKERQTASAGAESAQTAEETERK
jgi:Flp pilus assembly protein TadD